MSAMNSTMIGLVAAVVASVDNPKANSSQQFASLYHVAMWVHYCDLRDRKCTNAQRAIEEANANGDEWTQWAGLDPMEAAKLSMQGECWGSRHPTMEQLYVREV